MAETAKILSPQKTVLMPDLESGCPMADMITNLDVENLKKEHPDALVVSYVNTNADVKAVTDICCTSANAVRVVESIPRDREIIFVPDKYLGLFVCNRLKRDMFLWDGYCPTHYKITPQKIEQAKKNYPDAKVIVHPECTPEVIDMADEALSTGQMIKYISEAPDGNYLIGTETGMIYPLSKVAGRREVLEISDDITCPNMKLNTLEKILTSLEEMKHEITLDPDIIKRASRSLEAMIKI
jgi:quinolinate synthase